MIGDSANVSCKAQPTREVQMIPLVENFADEYINFQSAPLGIIGAGKQLGHAKKVIASSAGFKMDVSFTGPIVGRSIGGKIYNGPGKHHDELGTVQ